MKWLLLLAISLAILSAIQCLLSPNLSSRRIRESILKAGGKAVSRMTRGFSHSHNSGSGVDRYSMSDSDSDSENYRSGHKSDGERPDSWNIGVPQPSVNLSVYPFRSRFDVASDYGANGYATRSRSRARMSGKTGGYVGASGTAKGVGASGTGKAIGAAGTASGVAGGRASPNNNFRRDSLSPRSEDDKAMFEWHETLSTHEIGHICKKTNKRGDEHVINDMQVSEFWTIMQELQQTAKHDDCRMARYRERIGTIKCQEQYAEFKKIPWQYRGKCADAITDSCIYWSKPRTAFKSDTSLCTFYIKTGMRNDFTAIMPGYYVPLKQCIADIKDNLFMTNQLSDPGMNFLSNPPAGLRPFDNSPINDDIW